MIIHVAGTTGSGKTFVGDFIKKIYPSSKIKVIDLDDIIIPVLQSKKSDKIKDFNKMKKYILNTIFTKVNAIIKKHSNILFVGYDSVIFNKNNKSVLYRAAIPADYKFFITGDINVLVNQYRDRAVKIIQYTNRSICVDSVQSYKKMYNEDKKVYKKGYKFQSQEDVIKDIILLLN
jgi:adenylate kinase family enzyme